MSAFENLNWGIANADYSKNIIKVIGVGGGGGNAVKYMYKNGMKDVDFVICNTDIQALNDNDIPIKIQLGPKLTKGLGAGTTAEQGRLAATESREEIKALFADEQTQMVFITAGMGGGTGTGAAPEIANIAKELDILTVAVVTAPYNFEGTEKLGAAFNGIAELKKTCDTVLVVLNQKLAEMYPEMGATQAFAKADDVLMNAVKSVSEVITTAGKINSDFNDVKKVLKNAGEAMMSTGKGKGEKRAEDAIKSALTSPLLDNAKIKGAQRILVTVTTSSKEEFEVKMHEQTFITNHITQEIQGENKTFKFGIVHDDSVGEELHLTLIAAGFELGEGSIQTRILTQKTTQKEEGAEDKKEIGVKEEVARISRKELDDMIANFQKSVDYEELNIPAYKRYGIKIIP